MLQQNETLEQNESSLETAMNQKVAMTSPFSTPVTGNVMPYYNYTFIQHFHPPASPPQEQPCTGCQKNVIDELFKFLLLFLQLSPLERDTVIKMVKDASITAPITAKILKVVLAALKLTPVQWQAVLEIVKSGSLPAPVDTDGKLSMIINTTRTMTGEAFGKFKSTLMGSTAFKAEAEKLDLLETFAQIRAMTPGDFTALDEMAKNYSFKAPSSANRELKKILNRLGQLTIAQLGEILEMVKDASIT